MINTVGEFEETYGIPWKSTCFPFSPEICRKIDSDHNFRYDLEYLWRYSAVADDVHDADADADANDLNDADADTNDLNNANADDDLNYADADDDMYDAEPLSSLFGTGGYLVRNNGDRVDVNAETFKGKFVFVCCFHAPQHSHRIIDACHELYSSRDDVEVVMVAWINNKVAADDHRFVFDHFFSAFPDSCLAVPFEDSNRRANACNLVIHWTSCEFQHFPCLVIDTMGMALPLSERQTIFDYGAEAFPFTREALEECKARELKLTGDASNLEQLLLVNRCSPNVVYRFNPEGGPREEVSISELNNKLVGLYLLGRTGDVFPTLVEIYEQCLQKQLEFEIVVVYSDGDFDSLGLKHFQEMVDELLLRKHNLCRRWWCLPLDNSVSNRLKRVISLSYKDCYNDLLCMVGPACGFVGVREAVGVMKKYGIDGYPFNQEAITQKEVSKMREITLGSVLLGDDVFRGSDPDDIISSDKLSGKKICVYFGSLCYMLDREKVFSSYHDAKEMDPEFEAVFMYWKNDLDGIEVYNHTIYTMPWYVCPVNLARLEFVRKTFGISTHGIVGFGEDGRLCSCRSAQSATFILDDTLYQDVSERIFIQTKPFSFEAAAERNR